MPTAAQRPTWLQMLTNFLRLCAEGLAGRKGLRLDGKATAHRRETGTSA